MSLSLVLAVYIYGFFFMSLFKANKETIEIPIAFAVGLIFTTFFFYLAASGIDYSIAKKYLTQSESAEEFLEALRKDKIDYIIFNLGEFNRLQREYHSLDENQWRKMPLYLRHLQAKIVFQQNSIFVFKVTEERW